MKIINKYFWYPLLILSVSVVCVLISPYVLYKSLLHQDRSD